jgi:hypothetical protein
VSFGAELTVKSYIEHVKAAHPSLVIAQPCPALVTFMEIYSPGLLAHLAPADSPMMHTMKMVRRYYASYRDHRIAVISPCYAKRREFDEVGIGDYNVTINSLRAYMDRTGKSLASFEPMDYSNPPAERAVLFSSPGGLMRTVERESPEVARKVRKIEGPHTIYPYLEKLPAVLQKGMQPLLVDCLNCELGCNGGPGTPNRGKSPDEVEFPVEKRREEMQKSYRSGGRSDARARARLGRVLSRFWDGKLYARTYVDRSASFRLARPNPAEAREIEHRMLKFEKADFLNCSSCGYGNCDTMVVAIFNGLNKAENCHHYRQTAMQQEHAQIAELGVTLNGEIESAVTGVVQAQAMVQKVAARALDQSAALEESSAAIEEMIASISNSSRVSEAKQRAVEELVSAARQGETDMESTVEAIAEITRSVEGIWEMIEVINGVASKTNLLSMNASIEAAHAGDAGKGFSVVASEIRRLAEATAENAKRISSTLRTVADQMGSTSRITQSTGTVIHGMIQDIGGVASSITELINSLHEMSVGSSQITTALVSLRGVTEEVRDSCGQISDATRGVGEAMTRIGSLSRENLKKIGAAEGA